MFQTSAGIGPKSMLSLKYLRIAAERARRGNAQRMRVKRKGQGEVKESGESVVNMRRRTEEDVSHWSAMGTYTYRSAVNSPIWVGIGPETSFRFMNLQRDGRGEVRGKAR